MNTRLNRCFKLLCLVMLGVVAGCDLEKPANAGTASEPATEQEPQENSSFLNDSSEQIFLVLLAEYAYQQGDNKQAAEKYLQVAGSNPDPQVLKRATELTVVADMSDQALDLAKRWKTADPEAPEVNQYLLLLYQKKDLYQEAAVVLDELTSVFTGKPVKKIDIAAALLEQEGGAEQAYKTLEHYNNLQKEVEPEAWYYVALFAMRAKHFEKAVSATRTVSDMHDKGGVSKDLLRKAALLRVKAYTAMDKTDEALKELNVLIAEAADAGTRQTYARLLASLGKQKQAVALLDEVYKEDPDNTDILLDIIGIDIENGLHEEALPYVDKLAGFEKYKNSALYFRGLIFESLKRYDEALAEYSKIDEEERSDLKIQARIVHALHKSAGLEDAMSFLHKEQAATKHPAALSKLYEFESDLLRDVQKYDLSLQALQKASEIEPDNADIIYSQALVLELMGDLKSAEQKLLHLIAEDNSNSSALNALGYMLTVHTKRLDDAYRYIKQAYDLEPDDPAIIDSLGWVYYKQGRLDEAEKYLRMAFSKLKDPEVASHLIEVLNEKGQTEEAGQLLKEMLEQHPDDEKLHKVKSLIKG